MARYRFERVGIIAVGNGLFGCLTGCVNGLAILCVPAGGETLDAGSISQFFTEERSSG